MDRQAFHYELLGTDSHYVRLLKIIPKRGETSYLTLQHIRLQDFKGRYDAVSYTWGPEEPRRHVIVNGKRLEVRDNIWQFLKHVRKHKLGPTYLWVDSICINQTDNQERSYQVSRMADVYRSADRVLIWLGRTSQQFDPVQNTSHSLFQMALQRPENMTNWFKGIAAQTDSCSLGVVNLVMDIVHNVYWRRVWVLQETTLAREPLVIMRDLLWSKDSLQRIYHLYQQVPDPAELMPYHPILTGRSWDTHNMTLWQLITICRAHLCMDPRDHVYGLLGMVSSCHISLVDYTHCPEEVLLRALRSMYYEYHGQPMHVVATETVGCVMHALGVTSQSWVASLPFFSRDSTKLNTETCFETSLRSFMLLRPSEDTFESNSSSESRYIIIPSGASAMERYRMFMTVQSDVLLPLDWNIDKQETLLLCSISSGTEVALLVRKTRRQTVAVTRLVCDDTKKNIFGRHHYLSRQPSAELARKLNKKLNALIVDWELTFEGERFILPIQLSATELIEMADLYDPVS